MFPERNGKLDRKFSKRQRHHSLKKYAAPRKLIQEKICKGFEAVLAYSRSASMTTSLKWAGTPSRWSLQEALSELSLSSNSIFEGRTPGEIAERVGEARKNRYAGMNYKRAAYPMTDSQLGIYLNVLRRPKALCTIIQHDSVFRWRCVLFRIR